MSPYKPCSLTNSLDFSNILLNVTVAVDSNSGNNLNSFLGPNPFTPGILSELSPINIF